MAIALATAARNLCADAMVDLVDGGAGAGKAKVRDSTTVLLTFTLSDPAFGAAASGTAAANSLPKSTTGAAAGTADNYQVTQSDDTLLWSGAIDSGNTTLETVTRNAIADALADYIDTGGGAGKIVILDGATELCTITFEATAFGAASTGVCTGGSFPKNNTAGNTGTADGYEVRLFDDTVVWSGGISGDGITIDNVSIASGQTVNVTAATITVGATLTGVVMTINNTSVEASQNADLTAFSVTQAAA